ncbi:MAG TPA: RtcB family protein, partial [Longilinea sp.]|nr:RtcB family protein [Longilinea sp.]
MSQRDNQRTTNTAISGTATMRFRDEPVPIALFGEVGKDFGAAEMAQMEKAARLPVAVKAAIMPDGHPGYALPIGGVIGL